MKKCNKCDTSKELSHFRSRGNGKLQPMCKECHKLYDKIWHERNKQRRNALKRDKKKLRAAPIKKTIREYKNKNCADCGQIFPFYVMQFDHIDTNKEYTVGNMLTGDYSLEKIMKEISKCEVVCANCHAIRTWTRRVKQVNRSYLL